MNTNPFYKPYWETELEHHGVKGQSWGKRNGPPYPLDRGKDGRITKTQKKKKQSLLQKVKSKITGKKSKSKTKTKVSKENASNEDKEKLREKLLNSNDPKFLAKHMDLLSTQELNDRINRINTEKRLKDLSTSKEKSAVDKGMEWINKISKVAEATTKVSAAYTATYNAAQLKEKTKREADDAKRTAAEKRAAAKELNRILKDYGDNQADYSDIEIEFDPKTGKLGFKSKRK